MGKASKKKAGKAATATAQPPELQPGCPTKAELLATLDEIMLFDLRTGEDGRTPCLSPEGKQTAMILCISVAHSLFQTLKLARVCMQVSGFSLLTKTMRLRRWRLVSKRNRVNEWRLG